MDTNCLPDCPPATLTPCEMDWYLPPCKCFTQPLSTWPRVTSLNPPSAEINSPDVTLHVIGTNYTAQSVILFNGGEEPTTFVSATELTTLIKPSTATVVGSYPVQVRQPSGRTSLPRFFAFDPEAPATLAGGQA